MNTGNTELPLALQFGAGNIGRGFMGQLFFEAGYHTVFVDVDVELVRLINGHGHYPLRLLDAASRSELDLNITNVSALSVAQQSEVARAFAQADVVGTAVGVPNLEAIAPLIARGIELRRSRGGEPIDIYLCENVLDAFRILRDAVYATLDRAARSWATEQVGFVGTVVARMVPAPGERFRSEGPLFVVADSYHQLPYDAQACRSFPPPIEGMAPVDHFEAVVERKLFSYNLVHAALAYLGHQKGYTYVHQSFDDQELCATVYGALDEVGRALVKKFPGTLTGQDHERIKADIILRFSNSMIMDTVQRVARDPIRKLGPEDRLIGAARVCLAQGVFPQYIARIAGAALCYDNPDDPSAVRLQRLIAANGPKAALREISDVDPDSPGRIGELGRNIVGVYNELRTRRDR